MDVLVTLAIAQLVVAAVTAAIAYDKNRSPLLFFLLATCIGLLALILIACLTRRTVVVGSAQPASIWEAERNPELQTAMQREADSEADSISRLGASGYRMKDV